MTEEEKDRLIQAKRDVTEDLRKTQVEKYQLEVVDQRLITYVKGVIDRPEAHNLYEQLALRRFFRLADKYGVNVTEVQRFFVLYESLYFPGKKGPQRYKLTPIQCFQFAHVFGFWDGDNRVIKEVVWYVPRKYSKTTSSASLAIYDLLYGEANAESYTAANSYDQAKKCFDVIRGCLKKLDPKGRRYVINEETVKSRRVDRTAIAQCLTANAGTKDGLNASTVIMDEFSQAKDGDLYNVLTTSMGVRKNPLTVIITTASDQFDGPFYEMLKGYKALLLGEYEDDSVFAHLFEPDVMDDEGSEETWRKVHPHMDVTVSMEYYRRQYAKAKREGKEAMLAFRTKLLNVYAENETKSWISSTLARSISRPFDLSSLNGREKPDGVMAIDLSESDDFSAVSTGFYEKAGKSFFFFTKYFFPEGALVGHPNEKLYRVWADKGYLILTPGDVIDYRTIVDYVVEVSKKVRVLKIGYDPWKSQDVVNMLSALAGPGEQILRGVKQTYGYFTAPVQAFEHGAKTGHVFIDENPINAYCFGNAILDYDKLENCKPIKRVKYGKIDGVITKLMCMRLFLDTER